MTGFVPPVRSAARGALAAAVLLLAAAAHATSFGGTLTPASTVRYDASAGAETWQGVAPATLVRLAFDDADLRDLRKLCDNGEFTVDASDDASQKGGFVPLVVKESLINPVRDGMLDPDDVGRNLLKCPGGIGVKSGRIRNNRGVGMNLSRRAGHCERSLGIGIGNKHAVDRRRKFGQHRRIGWITSFDPVAVLECQFDVRVGLYDGVCGSPAGVGNPCGNRPPAKQRPRRH